MDSHDEYDDSNNNETPRANQLARRDFSGASLAVGNAATDALVAKARADIEARWIMAMRRPRNPDDVRQMIIKECRRPGFAKVATYSVPRGGKAIVGLSIRFAEVAARYMGNMPIEVQTIYDSDTDRIVRVTVTDLESNTTYSRDLTIKKTVERKQLARGQRPLGERLNSYGERVYIVPGTDEEVAVKEAAMVSKAMRTLILRLIPGHIQDEAEALCLQIARDQAAKDPDGERVRMLDAFASVAVYPSDLEAYLGHTTERLAPAELDHLRGVFRAIADGETTWQEAIANKPPAAATAASTTSAPAATGATNAAPAPASSAPATAAPASKATRSSKGTAALKDKLAEPAPAQPAPDKEPTAFDKAAADARVRDIARKLEEQKQADPEAEPGWMSGKSENGGDIGSASGEHGGSPDLEERPCAGCGVPIDVVKGDPPGQKCYACRNA